MGSSDRHYAYAPMSALFIVLSGLVLALPVIFVVMSLYTPEPIRFTMVGVAVALTLIALAVWLYYKPRELVLEDGQLRLVFPLRQLVVRREGIEGAEVLRRKDLRKALGFAVRVGVGGLFGVFGWLYSSRLGWVKIYATNTGDWLLLRTQGSRPLILSPADPDELARVLSG